ncbi:MAG: S41 family peptidase [Pseudodesulfovibrio sp.]|jgi:carboxyl-terminal processing protease|uniref:Peptidase S41 n=1 Tax=Pseudodesulfovibrio indicus TaxID=1716143 RepID=A0A126QNU2_9BACT|nr:S41 family peptidase [Pseudodesulfovibrio indicus]AMK11760.1 peptidase S41 [Pseudodesulfovibrio indicus]TDT88297.1 S41A family C-terminal processing peptidase-3 [Pseudodesulfovibrio indicus]
MRVTLWIVTFLLLFTLTVAPGPTIAANGDQFEALKTFSQVLDLVESNYVKPVTKKELIDNSIKGMLEELDPHSTYLSPEDFKDMQVDTAGKFSGIGIEISQDQGRLVVVSPIEDTPAYKAGLLAGDLILEIDGESTQDMTLMDAVKRIRGEKGTTVKLLILHKDSNKPVEIPIVRGTIPIVNVKTQSLEDGYLYLRLTKFQESSTKNLRDAIAEYQKEHTLKGIVFDLRNNPGGLLGQAVSVADTFIEDGTIVYIQGKDPANRKDFFASKNSNEVKVPLVTLINAGSASASEIVAGALQDHKRSLLVGERSFGKGSVQTIIPMSDGSGIKLTTALYYTPSGRSIQAKGIEPDLRIPFVAPNEDQEDMRDRFTVREKDLSGHLENGQKSSKQKKDEDAEKAKDMLARDNQLRMALELVKSLPRLREIQ